jgi:hypothetical protein
VLATSLRSVLDHGRWLHKKKIIMAKDLKIWIETRKRFHLSDAQIQMARELGLNPKKFGSLANHHQEPWKAPLPEFIEKIYFKRFRKTQPDNVRSIETVIKDREKKKLLRREEKKKNTESQQTASCNPAPQDT